MFGAGNRRRPNEQQVSLRQALRNRGGGVSINAPAPTDIEDNTRLRKNHAPGGLDWLNIQAFAPSALQNAFEKIRQDAHLPAGLKQVWDGVMTDDESPGGTSHNPPSRLRDSLGGLGSTLSGLGTSTPSPPMAPKPVAKSMRSALQARGGYIRANPTPDPERQPEPAADGAGDGAEPVAPAAHAQSAVDEAETQPSLTTSPLVDSPVLDPVVEDSEAPHATLETQAEVEAPVAVDESQEAATDAAGASAASGGAAAGVIGGTSGDDVADVEVAAEAAGETVGEAEAADDAAAKAQSVLKRRTATAPEQEQKPLPDFRAVELKRSLTTPVEQSPQVSSFGEVRNFWGKKSAMGFAGPSAGTTSRLSKNEAQATLQRLMSAGRAVDFDEVRRLRKLCDELEPRGVR